MRAAVAALALAAGCDSGSDGTTGPLTVDGTVTSLSPPGPAPGTTLLALQWFYEDGTDKLESASSLAVAATPLRFDLVLAEPTRYLLDLEALRALPTCDNITPGACWHADEPRLAGKGKLAVATFLVFEDGNGDGQYTLKPEAETVRGFSPVYLLYAKDLDADAIKMLGERTLMNPQALRPGFNFAKVRCKDKVGWKTSLDPFEIVGPESVIVESKEAYGARLKTAELCTNWM
jgi:hypothetical protein